ncbi:MAG: transglutaminase-like domain-containing protein [Minisyncoccia bacterium]
MKNLGQLTPAHESVEKKENGVEISATKESAVVSFRNLELNEQNPRSPEIKIVVEKQPVELVEGKSYVNSAVLIDKETERMQSLATQAEALLEIPENERPAKVLEILRSKMHYAYNDVLDKLSESDPDLAKWVAENTGLSSPFSHDVPLSDLVEKGYGVCRHLSVAYLWLAQKAGLKGVLLSSEYGSIKNIERTDTKQKLFRSADIGKPVSAHSWVEIKTSDGQWIPVDPSTKLVGDSEEGLAMFKEANYLAIGYGIDIDAEPGDKLGVDRTAIFFAPAEPTSSGTFCLELRSSKPTIRFGKENLPPTNVPYSGEGKLKIEKDDNYGGFALDILEVKVE